MITNPHITQLLVREHVRDLRTVAAQQHQVSSTEATAPAPRSAETAGASRSARRDSISPRLRRRPGLFASSRAESLGSAPTRNGNRGQLLQTTCSAARLRHQSAGH